ncbi:MAG TPA: hypothetical protein VF727_05350 [Allosphingosinicella sp.]|jgi:hypothetical protein
MRLEKQNRRSCIGILVFLVLLTALFLWMMFGGGVSRHSTADDIKGDIDGPAPPAGQPLPKGAARPPVAAKRP